MALAKGLKAAGHRPLLISNETYRGLVEAHGLELVGVQADMETIMQDRAMREAIEGGGLLRSFAAMGRIVRDGMTEIALRGLEAARGSDLVVAGMGMFVGLPLAEKLDLPFLQAHNVPFTPTRHFPGALFAGLPAGPGGILNLLSQHASRAVVAATIGPPTRQLRRDVLGLSDWRHGIIGSRAEREGQVLYGLSPNILPRPADWDPARIHVTGQWFLDEEPGWSAPPALQEFLDAGEAPVYVGFGSMSSRDPGRTAAIALEALEMAGARGIAFRGWGGMEVPSLPDRIHLIDSTPHSWLFPRMSAIVHHGGAGTTAAALRAGIPSIVVPFHGDQPFWGERVHALGAGPRPIPRRRLSARGLAAAIVEARRNASMIEKSRQLGQNIRSERGVETAVRLIEGLFAGGKAS